MGLSKNPRPSMGGVVQYLLDYKMYYCRACRSKIIPFFSLGKIPLANKFLKESELEKKEKKYDLTIAFCPRCYLVQLTKNMSPKELFEDYIYFSSNSSTLKKHFEKTSEYLARKLKFNKNSLVLEIASNDGIFLKYFKKRGIQILGVDPAKNIAKIANKNGIKTIPQFFNFKFAHKLKKKGVAADLVYGANVLAHVPNIVDFVRGISLVLKPQGCAIFEFPYLYGLFEGKFDVIYHEHVFYYSLISLINLFKRANLEIYEVEFVETQGGSLRIYLCHKNTFRIKKSVGKLHLREKQLGFDKAKNYGRVANRAEKIKKDLLTLLKSIKRSGKKIAAYSAPAKGNILLNYTGVGSNYLDFIVDLASEKQGLYTPGTHMQVFHPDKIFEENPDYLVVLCWNISREITAQLKEYKKNGGKFIIPIPKIQVI